MKINFIDLKRQYQQYKRDINQAIDDVLESAAFINGPQIAELEEKLAAFVGVKHAIACASGTDALLIALKAQNIQPGDEIITTPFTFVATGGMIIAAGARPVFVDIKEDTYNINPANIADAITDKTRGIIAVDIFGQCADYDAINAIAREKKLFVIEDAAQSFGAEYKDKRACSLADIGCTSFFPAKTFGCYGDGGMIFTNDQKRADLMRSIRAHGKGTSKYDIARIGLNSRLDTVQAAILLAKLPYFTDEIVMRDSTSRYYTEKLQAHVTTPYVEPHNHSVFAQYCVRVKNREKLIETLKQQGIPTAIHYPKPLHLQKGFEDLGYKEGDFPIAEAVCENIVALPMHPFLTQEEQDTIINSVTTVA